MVYQGQELFDYAAISRLTGVPAKTLRVWRQRGQMPQPDFRLGRTPAWRPESLAQWLPAHTIPGHVPPDEGINDGV